VSFSSVPNHIERVPFPAVKDANGSGFLAAEGNSRRLSRAFGVIAPLTLAVGARF